MGLQGRGLNFKINNGLVYQKNKMRKIIILAVLVIGMIATAQTQVDLSGMTENTTLGSNCGQGQTPQEYITTSDVNLNGKTLNLRNIKLIITGNLNGAGNITHCGGSNLAIYGNIQNNPNTNAIPINYVVLDLKEFKIEHIRYYENVRVFDLQGKFISNGLNLLELKKNVYIITARGYKSKKILIN